MPAYLVFGSEGTPPFEIERIAFGDAEIQNTDRILSAESLPGFSTLVKLPIAAELRGIS